MLSDFYKTINCLEQFGKNIVIPDSPYEALYLSEHGELFCYVGIYSKGKDNVSLHGWPYYLNQKPAKACGKYIKGFFRISKGCILLTGFVDHKFYNHSKYKILENYAVHFPVVNSCYFGINKKVEGTDLGMYPVKSKTGIDIMSVNLLLKNDTDPVVWRGPVIAGTVKQFWTDVIWSDVDFMFIDMPPGTGDVPLTVFQAIPLNGIVVVTLPQDLVSLIVKKSYNMAKRMNIPILGMVQNMSYVVCPHCGETINLFGSGSIENTTEELDIKQWAKLPIDPEFTSLCDQGRIEDFDASYLTEFADKIKNMMNSK
jgi:hypothetical protein